MRTRSFRAAAHVLHLSQPAVSGQIARLERELHLTLLDRGPTGSILTPEGKQILPHLLAFVESTELIRRASVEIQGVVQQTLTIVGETRHLRVVLPDTLGMLKRHYDRLTVRVEAKSEVDVYRAIRAGNADLGLVVLEGPRTVPDDITNAAMFDLGPLGVAVRPGLPALAQTTGPIDPTLLQGEPLIMIAGDGAIEAANRFFPPDARCGVSVVDDVGVGIELVHHGLGLMVVTSITAYLANPDVEWRELIGGPIYTGYIAHAGESRLTQAARMVMDRLAFWTTKYSEDFHHNRVTGQLEVSDGLMRPPRAQ